MLKNLAFCVVDRKEEGSFSTWKSQKSQLVVLKSTAFTSNNLVEDLPTIFKSCARKKTAEEDELFTTCNTVIYFRSRADMFVIVYFLPFPSGSHDFETITGV